MFKLSYLFPCHCPYCDKLILSKETACKKCIEEFPERYVTHISKRNLNCYSPFPYSGKYSEAVKKFKFNNRTEYAKSFAQQMSYALQDILSTVKFDYITCVPMHKINLNKRGYNQAEILARNLSEIIGIPYADTLIKYKSNNIQHKCKLKERFENVKGVYKISNKEKIKNKNILIVDDIVTSGCTLRECCKTLTHNGASKLYCTTVCTVRFNFSCKN